METRRCNRDTRLVCPYQFLFLWVAKQTQCCSHTNWGWPTWKVTCSLFNYNFWEDRISCLDSAWRCGSVVMDSLQGVMVPSWCRCCWPKDHTENRWPLGQRESQAWPEGMDEWVRLSCRCSPSFFPHSSTGFCLRSDWETTAWGYFCSIPSLSLCQTDLLSLFIFCIWWYLHRPLVISHMEIMSLWTNL